MAAAAEHVERALDFCDRALDHLTGEEPNVGEALPLMEGMRNELLALKTTPELGEPDAVASTGQKPATIAPRDR